MLWIGQTTGLVCVRQFRYWAKAIDNEVDYFLQNDVLEVAIQKRLVKDKRQTSADFAIEQKSGLWFDERSQAITFQWDSLVACNKQLNFQFW